MNKIVQLLKEQFHSKVLKAGLTYVVGSVLLKGIAFLSTPLFTNLMSTSEYGKYGAYLSFESILNIIITLGVANTIRNATIDFGNEIDKYVSSILALITIPFIFLFILVNLLYSMGINTFGFSFWITNLLLCHAFGSAVIEIVNISYSIRLKTKQYLIVSFSCSVINIVVSVILMLSVMSKDKFVARIVGLAGTYFLIAMILYCRKVFTFKSGYQKEYWKYSLKMGIPMIVFYIGYSLLNTFDRVMIGNMCGKSDAGIYSFSYNIANILNIVITALFTAWVPWLYEKISLKEFSNIKRRQKRLIQIVLIGAIVFSLMSPEVIKFMAPDAYSDGMDITPILIGGMYLIFVYNFLGYTELYYKKTGYLTVGTWVATIFNITLNYIFIKIFGYRAAAYTTFLSFFLLFIAHRMIVKIKFGDTHILKTNEDVISTFVLTIFAGVSVIFARDILIRYIIILLVVSYSLFIFGRKNVKNNQDDFRSS